MRTKQIANALFPGTRGAILSATLGHPERSWYLVELARHLRRSPSSLQRELASLVASGILRRTVRGRQVYFQAESRSPVFTELRGIVLKTVGLVDVLRRRLKPFQDQMEWAFVYGSLARGQEQAESDVDLFVVGQLGLAELAAPLRKAERSLDRPVNVTLRTTQELTAKTRSKEHFVNSVLSAPKLFVLGDEDEFDEAFGR